VVGEVASVKNNQNIGRLESDLEKLAAVRARRRVRSWSKQLKTPLLPLVVLLASGGPFGLFFLWAGAFPLGNTAALRLAIVVTMLVGALVVLLYVGQQAWDTKQFRRLYEEELLELKVIGGSNKKEPADQ